MVLQNTKVLHSYVNNYTEDFFTQLETDGSKKTQVGYMTHIKQFSELVFNRELKHMTKEDLNSITVDTIIDYKNKLYNSKYYMNSTINNKLTAIKQFLRYMKFRKQYVNEDIGDLAFVHNLKDDSVPYDTITMDMVKPAIEYIMTKEKHLQVQKKWFIKIAIETGLRSSEILRLKKSNFTVREDDYVLIKSDSETKGKGNKDWKELIHVNVYNEMAEELFREDDEMLFTISDSTLLKSLKRVLSKLGYEGNYVLHSFKRTAVNNTHEYTGDIYASQAKGKHTNINTTIDNYMDDVKYGATGHFSMQHKNNQNLFNEVDEEILKKALNNLDEHVKILINKEIQNNLKEND